ncbi:MAG: toll/interleukin-1 receptor domain-containing protein [Bacteroidota bacterium]
MSIFISYNHKDYEKVAPIVERLKEEGFEVIIDREAMQTGEQIKAFILRAVRESGLILSMLSRNSLASPWVSYEFVLGEIQQDLAQNHFWSLSIDPDVFGKPNLIDELYDLAEERLEQMKQKRSERDQKNRGTVDLDPDIERQRDHHHHLDKRFKQIKENLTLDFSSPEKLTQNLPKLIEDLKKN